MKTLITPSGNTFYVNAPAKSPVLKVLNDKGQPVMDALRLTGNYTEVEEFRKKKWMIEVEHSFGTDEINEDFIIQN